MVSPMTSLGGKLVSFAGVEVGQLDFLHETDCALRAGGRWLVGENTGRLPDSMHAQK
jgi:hypothetical protein